VVVSSIIALSTWVISPLWVITGFALITAGALHALRLAQWKGWRTKSEPLVLVLHLGCAWLPIGLIILGGAIVAEPALITSGLHALTVGAIGTMTLAIMTRATLGHTGRQLSASKATSALYIAITISALCRVCAAFYTDIHAELLIGAAAAWILAFTLFVAVYGPMHLRPRVGALAN
jgi:uncharacterized protein involved in response to NO